MLNIRPYEPSDWPAVEDVHDRARLSELAMTVGADAFRDLSSTAEEDGLFNGELWVAESDAGVVGFVCVEDQEITWLYVHPAQQGKGIGRRLLDHALSRIEGEATAWVLAGNEPALRLYTAAGFTICETKAGHLAGSPETSATGHRLARAACGAAA